MGIQEDIKELKIIMLEQEVEGKKKKEKKERIFKIPVSKKVRSAQVRKNFITVMKINDNGAIEFKKAQIDEQTIMDDGIPRLATANYILTYKRTPIVYGDILGSLSEGLIIKIETGAVTSNDKHVFADKLSNILKSDVLEDQVVS